MIRRFIQVFVAALASAALLVPGAAAHKADPNYESVINRVAPAVQGLRVDIINRGDQLQLRNQTGRTVVVIGYNDEPYARILPDGTVEVNKRSPAFYLNQDRYGQVTVPAFADEKAAPQWQTLDKTATFEWHDHRIHWMAKGKPQQVKDESIDTKIFDWKVTLRVGNQPATVTGTLFWRPTGGSAPVGAIVGLIAFVVASGLFVWLVRRRRRLAGEGAPVATADREAW